MTKKQKLYYLIKELKAGRYEISTFTSEFCRIYDIENDDEDILNEAEDTYFRELSCMCGRYSKFVEDFIGFPGAFYNDKDILKKADECPFNLN